jgi:ActR/RegA family two-component response regulator
VLETALDVAFIPVSGTAGEAVAVAAMKAGARDYLMKANLARLLAAIERELRENDRGAAVAGRLANQGRR